ncbi:MAG TPA: hypothetical protein VGF95_12490 [Solirubrobacteraceae bacterium]|jgi:hypothetical protein
MLAVALSLALSGVASAAEPWWHLGVGARPSRLPAAHEATPGQGELTLTAENVGDRSTFSEGTKGGGNGPVTVLATLPAGLRAVGIAGAAPSDGGALGETTPMTCSLESLRCQTSLPVAAYDQLEVRIAVEVLSDAGASESVEIEVSGGTAPTASMTRSLEVGEAPAGLGVEDYELQLEAEGGGAVTQAGSHPFQITGTIALDQDADAASLTEAPQASPSASVEQLTAALPPGLIADPGAAPRCLAWQFTDALGGQDECPYESAVGAASVTFFRAGAGTLTVATPIFNIEPEAGEPARFGFYVPGDGVPVFLTTGVRSGPGEDWGVDLSALEVPATAGLISARVTFWGVPGDSTHDESRGWSCLASSRGGRPAEPCIRIEPSNPPAFVTLPTRCSGALSSSLQAVSSTGQTSSFSLSTPLRGMSGCATLAFTPTVSVTPSTHAASSPSGLSLALNFDTEGLTSAKELAQSDLADTTVTLPEGLTIDPSAGVGLGACSEAQYAEVTPTLASGCPEDSKLGTVEIETPLLFTTLNGSLYLAQPYENQFPEAGHPGGSLIALYVVARSRAERGILIKLAGSVSANPATGQLSVSFDGDPELPFSHFTFHFREGAQAPLISPATCGSYSALALLAPFSEPSTPLADEGSFQIASGSEGSACPGAKPPFMPAIKVGTIDPAAGVFSPFFVELSRSDAMSEISSYSAQLPLGVTADLTGVPFCPEADIEAARGTTGLAQEQDPSCPQQSAIGDTLVGTGVGSVLDYVPGKLYFAGPFNGDPFSVVSVTSAVIGPFDLGTIVIRFGLKINPETGQVGIDPTGSEPIPTILHGIVTHVRTIKISIDRRGFTLNPTSCAAHPAESTLTSSLGQVATVSTAFGIGNCKELSFKPKFTAQTSGKTSRKLGASLSVKLAMNGKLGSISNIKKVRVELPKQLPSQLKTLQHACTDKQFETNPNGCPKASFVGQAKAVTPILPVPLTGPAIFVSHGTEWPSLVLALKGYGVTIDLIGATHISPKGITSTTFKTVPDEPVGSFQLTLPQGSHPALAANGNLCKPVRLVRVKGKVKGRGRGRKRVPTSLFMPTTFTAQNGRVVHQRTKIEVTGCAGKHRGGRGRRGG